MAAVTPPEFIGRAEPLTRLRSIIERAEGDVVLVSGEAGVGKTRLVQEAIGDRRAHTLVGASSPASLGRPFDLLLSAVEPAVRGWTRLPADLSGVGAPLTALLASTAPGLDTGSGSEQPGSSDQIGAGIALLRHLDPRVIVAEDLHWADVESLQVLERLVSSPARPTLVLTYRPEDVTPGCPTVELLGVVEGRGAPLHLHLEPFDLDEVAQYVRRSIGDVWSPRVLAQLHARSGGSPFFLEQLICHAAADPAGVQDQVLPWSLAETVRLATDDLASDERDLLSMAAVLGSRFDFDLLQAALAVDEAELIDRLRRVVGRRLLVEHDTDEFTFRHELVRDSILESLLGRERRRLHDAAYDAVEAQRPHDFAELARHAMGARCVDNLLALAPRGVEHYLATGSTYQALRLAGQALDEAPDDRRLRELGARAGWLAGKLDEAMEHAAHWLALERQAAGGRVTDALILVARVAFETGDDTTRAGAVDELTARLDHAGDDHERARILAGLAQHHMLRGSYTPAIEHAEAAIELATTLGDDAIRRSATVELGSAISSMGGDRIDEGVAILRRVAAQAERAEDFVAAARALHNLVPFVAVTEAAATVDAMRDAAQRGGIESMAVHAHAFKRADVALLGGDLKDALAWVARSRQLGRRTRDAAELATLEALLLAEADQADQMAPLIDEAASEQRGDEDEAWLVVARVISAARRGDADDVRSLLPQLAAGRTSAGLVVWALRDLLAAGLATDEIAAAAGDPAEGRWGPVVAALLAAHDRADDAADRIDRILADPAPLHVVGKGDEMPVPLVIEAELLAARAELANLAGDRQAGREAADAAAERLGRWPGVRRDAALALVRAGSIGGATSSDELTGRELDVARLVARGLSNGGIADELFISRKTVSTHVSHILAKLGMSSRTEVAAWAIREGVAVD